MECCFISGQRKYPRVGRGAFLGSVIRAEGSEPDRVLSRFQPEKARTESQLSGDFRRASRSWRRVSTDSCIRKQRHGRPKNRTIAWASRISLGFTSRGFRREEKKPADYKGPRASLISTLRRFYLFFVMRSYIRPAAPPPRAPIAAPLRHLLLLRLPRRPQRRHR